MSNETLNKGVLLAKHRAVGIGFCEDEDFAYLLKDGKPTLVFNARTVTVDTLRRQADRLLNQELSGVCFTDNTIINWDKSGIEFGLIGQTIIG